MNEIIEQTSLAKQTPSAPSTLALVADVDGIVRQMNAIQELIAKVLREGDDYGYLPGTEPRDGDKGAKAPKKMLFKPGAEKIARVFSLVPRHRHEILSMPGGHREVRVTCTLTHGPSGTIVGEASAVCTTMESKYRWRGQAFENTGEEIPRAYWDAKRAGDRKGAEKMLGGPGFGEKKINGRWMKVRYLGERVENPDLADTLHTIISMAEKRAFVAAVRTATAASSVFSQDPDEGAEGIEDDAPVDSHDQGSAQPPAKAEPRTEAPPRKTTRTTTDCPAMAEFRKQLQAITPVSGVQKAIGDLIFGNGEWPRPGVVSESEANFGLDVLKELRESIERDGKPDAMPGWQARVHEIMGDRP